jgi:hypothetical protein
MTRYRLPDELGGGEYEALTDFRSKAGDGWRHRFNVPGVGLVDVPTECLIEVRPPLPPEPPVGAVVLFGGEAVQRFEDNELADDASAHWASVGTTDRWTWARLVEIGGTLVHLASAPEPVALPWSCYDAEVSQTHDEVEGPGRHVYVSTKPARYGYAHLKPAEAREMARALWTAADAVEAQP